MPLWQARAKSIKSFVDSLSIVSLRMFIPTVRSGHSQNKVRMDK